MTSEAPAHKLPRLEPETAFFWTAGSEGVLRIQRCSHCGTYQHPPFPLCAQCQSDAVAPEAMSGKGRLASYTVNCEAWVPGLAVPFVFGVVELVEQPQLYVFTNVLAEAADVRIGMPLRVTFERHEDVWLPMFREDEAA
ncbi:Zn-ribbon domain-containing OB-fold protein [Novosphingobium soli]|uniref:Zn-ribbon domain-containing OB-fold protein n=1 Tax=Novosphingobium soli TaxID=574956 RepID=A0ABV6CU10_9SPHN